jgi:hypothetical protein
MFSRIASSFASRNIINNNKLLFSNVTAVNSLKYYTSTTPASYILRRTLSCSCQVQTHNHYYHQSIVTLASNYS